MNPKQIIQARIDELKQDLRRVVDALKEEQNAGGGQSMSAQKDRFERLSRYKDQVLGLRSAIAELENVKEKV